MRNIPFILIVILLVTACSEIDSGNKPLKTGWYQVVEASKGIPRKLQDSAIYHLDPEAIISAAHFKTIKVESLPHADTLWQVVTQLDEEGRVKFATATERLIGEDLAFVLDDSIWTEPIRIQAKIPSGILVISKKGGFSQEDAKRLKDRLENIILRPSTE